MRRFTILFAVTSLAAVAAADAWADITISTDQTQNMNCSGGICSPAATDAVLNVNDLGSMLAAGDLTVTTTGGAIQANNIVIATGVSWAAATTLVLDAYETVDIDALVSVAGPGNLTLEFRDGGRKGAITYDGGSITFASLTSVLTMNQKVYALVGDIKTLASDIQAKSIGKFALAAPYDASQDGTYSKVPIPTLFNGSFDGLGNTISNLSINDATELYIGLFAQLGSAQIANLNLADVNINSSYNPMANAINLGAIAGKSSGTLWHVSVTGKVSDSTSDTEGSVAGGGLVGINENGGIITHCTTAVALSAGEFADAYLGGLAGSNGTGKISGSVASGTVTESAGPGVVGGAVGTNAGLIETSHAEGNVTANGGNVGGLVGEDNGSITTSYATGSVNGDTAGGLVGAAGVYQSDTISESFATGSVTGYWGGGLVGSLSGSATNSYADGEVEASVAGGFAGVVSSGSVSDSYAIGNVPGKKYSYRGGFAGEDLTSAGMKASYWDTDTSGRRNGTGNRGNEPGIKGLTTTQLQSGLPKGFDNKVWAETAGVNNGLPYLIKNPPPQ